MTRPISSRRGITQAAEARSALLTRAGAGAESRQAGYCRAVSERGVELASALRGQVENVPERIVFVDATLFDVVREPGMHAIEVAHRSFLLQGENGNRRVLVALPIFASEVVLEAARGGAQQTKLVPTASACVRAQRRQIGRRDDRQVDVLCKVMRDAIE